jgi:hypothetical protein
VTRPLQAWERLADVLLEREALVSRVVEDVLPRELAGLYVTDDDVEQALQAVPGLASADPARLEDVVCAVEPRLRAAREAFTDELAGRGPFAHVVRAAHLDTPAAEVLALVAAAEFDRRRQRLLQYVQDDVQLPRPTLATLAHVHGRDEGLHSGHLAVAPGSPLLRAALVTVTDDGPWGTRMCGLPARVAWHLRGDDGVDDALPGGAQVLTGSPVPPTAGREVPEPGLLLVHGGDRISRLQVVERRWPGATLLVTPVPQDAAAWAAVVREATLRSSVVVCELDGPLDAAGREVVTRATHLSVVLSSARELPLDTLPDRSWAEAHVASGDAGPADWAEVFGAQPQLTPRLSREQLRLVSAAARADGGQLAPAVRRLAGGHLDGLARRIRPRRTWDDLVLPADQEGQLRELSARHRRRGTVYGEWGFSPLPSTGVVALFAGPSGTGKTLAAEVVAGDLGLDLYKVDLSSVVSKYIGETEKNLERIFDAAAAGDLVLFFDEADALFGKRSEVSDAHDRYANIEVAYLLQRLEAYDGMVVLATNLQRNIDPAFTRRIAVAVDFAVPEQVQRRAIWERSLPSTAPVAELDLDFLARQFKVTGGVISGAVLGAAFRAAEEGSPITMEHVVLSLRREFQKLGRLRTEAEFGPWFPLVAQDGGRRAAPAR